MYSFLANLTSSVSPTPDDNVFSGIWKEYERVIVLSLITSFGLDFLVHDQHGGDVDTVNTVRETGVFKNSMYQSKFDNRGKYDPREYHTEAEYLAMVRQAKERYAKEFTTVKDTYVPGRELHFSKGAGSWRRPALDHVISAHEIHDDPVRILSNIKGVDLANVPENLSFTNLSLNAKMQDKSIEAFIEWCDNNPDKVNWDGIEGKTLPDDVKQRMLEEDREAREFYYKTIEKSYYSSSQFYQDACVAAKNRGIEMGARQALGYFFLEIWMSCKEELLSVGSEFNYSSYLKAIKTGIRNGCINALNNYGALISHFGQGFTAGALSSFATTLINTFLVTNKDLVKYIRYGFTSIVQACNVLLINPNDLLLGEQLKLGTIIIASGASNIVGSYIGDSIAQTSLANIETLGKYVIKFTSTLISGLLSCTLLLLLDRSVFFQNIFAKLDQFVSTERELKQITEQYYEISAKLHKYDLSSFIVLCKKYDSLGIELSKSKNEIELNDYLIRFFKELNIALPWNGDFDDFMSDKSKPWCF